MKFSNADWLALRMPIAVIVVVMLSGAALVAGTHAALKKTNANVIASEKSLKEARDQLYKSGEEKNRILRFSQSYLDLQQAGFVGEEERINWVDALRATSLQLKLFGANYQIEARQAYKPQGLPDTGNFHLYRSVMKLDLGLLHEEDLMRFLGALANQKVGLFSLQTCSLQNSRSGGAVQTKGQPNLKADCTIDWITLSESKEQESP
ncbi:MAG: hypothetical protein Q8O37_07885 [Sulfuricellaceae bacterium]|nr:hypothetical protein [Sulfuricellaceae bacterium]